MPLPPGPRVDLAPLGAAAQRGAAASVPRLATGVVAFVGRALKGPIGDATRIGSFAEFQQRFGGLWQPAPMGYAIEQFFEQGGREALVVRVANGGRAPTLSLPAGRGELLLRGVVPGSREYLRASVDYDGVAPGDEQHFNLVLQRLRAPESELVDEQETHAMVSVREESPRSLAHSLARSRLARLAGPLPPVRPERTGLQGRALVGYVAARADGTDGEPVSDYDLVGERESGTGLFALLAGPRFELLYVPPPTRDLDLGPTALLVAARICRARQALLVVDAPAAWDSPGAALERLPGWPFRSEHALLAWPRLLAQDRLRGRTELFAPGGAVAGLLARGSGEGVGPPAGEPGALRGAVRPACGAEPAQRAQLARLGVNVLEPGRPRAQAGLPWRLLQPGGSGHDQWLRLGPRRLALWIQSCVLEGTRWLALEPAGEPAWARARAQVAAFLADLAAAGRLAAPDGACPWRVVCDGQVNGPAALAAGEQRLLCTWHPAGSGAAQSCLFVHGPAGSTVRTVTPNPLAGQAVALPG